MFDALLVRTRIVQLKHLIACDTTENRSWWHWLCGLYVNKPWMWSNWIQNVLEYLAAPNPYWECSWLLMRSLCLTEWSPTYLRTHGRDGKMTRCVWRTLPRLSNPVLTCRLKYTSTHKRQFHRTQFALKLRERLPAQETSSFVRTSLIAQWNGV